MSEEQEKTPVELNSAYIEAVGVISGFHEQLKGLGLEYSAVVSLWEKGDDKAYTTHLNSDPIARQRVLSTAILPDGRARLIDSQESVYPANADLHPENARIIQRKTSVSYTDEPVKFTDKFFGEIVEIFQAEERSE